MLSLIIIQLASFVNAVIYTITYTFSQKADIMDNIINNNEKAYFFTRSTREEIIVRLDLNILVGGVARNKDDLDTLHPFGADPFYRFYYVTDGEVDLLFADGRYSLRPGYMYLIPVSQPFRYISPCNFTHYWMHFCSSLLEKIEFFQHLIELPAPADTEVLMLDFLRFAQIGTGIQPFMEADIILRRLLIPFLESIPDEPLQQIEGQNRFYSVIDYINRNATKPLSISSLAAMFRMNRNEFSADFHRAFGIPPKQYICKRRMGQARMLLLSTALSVKQISYKVGYDNEFYFSRLFKKYTGNSPSDFRKHSNLGT